MPDLTRKQERFIEEYLLDLNATAAAIRTGYSAKTAHVQGCRLLKHVKIADEIKSAMEERGQRTKMTADRVLLEIERMANIDPTKYEGVRSLKDLKKLPAAYRRAVVGWGWDKHNNFVLKLAKEFATDRLGKHHRLFADVVEHKGVDALADRMAKARERVKGKI